MTRVARVTSRSAEQTPEKVDDMLVRLDNARCYLQHVQANGGVKRTYAELDLLVVVEEARESMLDVLIFGDRKMLIRIFGSPCIRVSRIHETLNGVEFSPMNASDQRIPTCRGACESIEQVLQDLGLGDTLQIAQMEARDCVEKGEAFNSRESTAVDSIHPSQPKDPGVTAPAPNSDLSTSESTPDVTPNPLALPPIPEQPSQADVTSVPAAPGPPPPPPPPPNLPVDGGLFFLIALAIIYGVKKTRN